MSDANTTPPQFISKQVLSGQYLFVDLAPALQEDFSIVCAGREECTPDYEMHRSGFQYFAIEYIVSGRWEISSEGKTREIGPGTVFAYAPDTRYDLKAIDQTNLVKYFVDFLGHQSQRKLNEAKLPLGTPLQLVNPRLIGDILDQILSLSQSQRYFAKKTGTLLTELLLLRIQENGMARPGHTTHAHAAYMRCRSYMQSNFASVRRAEEVARHCHIDPAYMSRLFKRFSGESPYQFLTRRKVDYATELLLHQNMTVKEAASRVGFDDPYHFSRVFKSTQGLSPKKFVGAMQRGGPPQAP